MDPLDETSNNNTGEEKISQEQEPDPTDLSNPSRNMSLTNTGQDIVTSEMEDDAEATLRRELEWSGVIPKSAKSDKELESLAEEGEDEYEEYEEEELEEITCDPNVEQIIEIRNIPDYLEAYDQDGEITLMGEESTSDVAKSNNANAVNPEVHRHHQHPGREFTGTGRENLMTLHMQRMSDWENGEMLEEEDDDILIETEDDDHDDGILLETENNCVTGSVIPGHQRKRNLPSPILWGENHGFIPADEQSFHNMLHTSDEGSFQLPPHPHVCHPDDVLFEEEVLLVPGVNECTVGNMEAILDCMKNCCGSSQHFRMVDNLELALRRCQPGGRIFVGCGEHPISSLGVLSRGGGQISGPHSGFGQAVISPTTSDHVWLNVMRSSQVAMQNVTILLDKVNFNGKPSIGPSVGLLVQGKLRLNNVIITTKLNDNAENPSRPITGIELTERTSLQLQQSTIKHCSVGLISQNEAESEILDATITHCVIGFQSSLYAKNYIKDMTILHCNNYAMMVDSEIHCGEGTVDDLKAEESFFIESIKVHDCSTEVYFIGLEPEPESSGSSSDSSGSSGCSLNKTT